MANFKSKSTEAEQEGEGKKVITPETINKALIASEKAGFTVGLISCGIILIMMIFLVALFNLSDAFGGLIEPWPEVIYTILIALPIFAAIFVLYAHWKGLKNITEGNYILITDDVQRVVTDDKIKRRWRHGHAHYYTEHAMYLYKCGRQVISLEQTYTISEGDIYYAVVNKKHPTSAVLLYNSKFYDLEDIEVE